MVKAVMLKASTKISEGQMSERASLNQFQLYYYVCARHGRCFGQTSNEARGQLLDKAKIKD
jgi:hypothetical protein